MRVVSWRCSERCLRAQRRERAFAQITALFVFYRAHVLFLLRSSGCSRQTRAHNTNLCVRASLVRPLSRNNLMRPCLIHEIRGSVCVYMYTHTRGERGAPLKALLMQRANLDLGAPFSLSLCLYSHSFSRIGLNFRGFRPFDSSAHFQRTPFESSVVC